MRTYRRLLQIFFLALILGSASGLCHISSRTIPATTIPSGPRTSYARPPARKASNIAWAGPLPPAVSTARASSGGPTARMASRSACDQVWIRRGPDMPCQELAPARRHHGLQDQQRPPRPAYRHLCRQQYLHPQPQPRQDRTPRTCSLLGQQVHRGTPHRHLIPLQERTKSAGDRAFFVPFRHPVRQAALSRIPAFFLCGRRGWHLAIRSF